MYVFKKTGSGAGHVLNEVPRSSPDVSWPALGDFTHMPRVKNQWNYSENK